jgi:hypothetical protein
LADDVWRWGIASVFRELFKRDWLRAAGSSLRVLGMLRGFAVAIFVPVRSGHFRVARERHLRGRASSSS